MKRTTLIRAGAAAAIALVAAPLPAADSGGYRGPNRDGIHPETGLLKRWPESGLKLLWRWPADDGKIWDWTAGVGSGMATPGVFGGTVYVSGVQHAEAGERRLITRAFTLDGKLKWKSDCGPGNPHGRFDGPRATPEIDGEYLYATTGLGRVNCLDPKTGKVLWWFSTRDAYGNKIPGYGYDMSPVIAGEVIAAPVRRGTGTMVGYHKITGRPMWLSEPSTYAIGDSSPVAFKQGGRDLIAASLWWATVVVDASDGKVVWRMEQPNGFTLTPVVYKDRLIASVSGRLCMWRVVPGEEVLKQVWDGPQVDMLCQIVVLGGRLYGISRARVTVEGKDGKPTTKSVPALCCYDLDTGGRLHATAVPWSPRSLVAADGMIYVISTDNTAPQDGSGLYREKALIGLYKPGRDGVECVGSFTPALGTKEIYVAPTIAAGRLFHRHGNLLAVYDLRPESYR